MEKITYLISSKGYRNNYKNFVKTFNNEKHFENWYKLMIKKGLNIIGIELLKTN